MDKVKMTTPDGVTENIEKLAALFPAAVTEMRGEDGKLRKGIDFEKLRQLLSCDIVEGGERYEFSWVGKKAAMAEAARPTTETLRPVKADSRNWDTTENLYIEGDNLAALKILQESYLGKVKMIYIDPPYNTGNDFIYKDNTTRTQYEEDSQMGMFDDDDNHLFKNTDSNGRFHSDWCSMIYARLLVARNLLASDGIIFISISDDEQSNLKKICDNVFGEKSFVTTIHIELSATQGMKVKAAQAGNIVKNAEYILVYSKNGRKDIAQTPLYDYRPEYDSHYSYIISDDRSNYYLLKDYVKKIYPEIHIENLVDMYTNNHIFKMFVDSHTDRIFRFDKTTGFSKTDFKPKVIYNNYQANGRTYTLYNNGIDVNQLMFLSQSFGECDDFQKNKGLRKIRGDWWKDFYKDMGNVSKEGNMAFSNGKKPVRLIYQLAKMITSESSSDIILDFFSGSATTAHAVMQLNAEDGGHRKFIMVQLPEPCDEKSEAYKAGYKNICEIGKERIRRAGDKIKTEHPDADLDIGFRVFRVDSSNMRDVFYKPEEFTQTMLGEAVSNIKPDRTDLDLLYACLLDCGVPIHLPHTTTTVDGCTIHNVDNGALMACFDEHIPHSVIRAMAAEAPLQVIFRDSAFAADADKINVTEIFKNLSPDTKVRVI